MFGSPADCVGPVLCGPRLATAVPLSHPATNRTAAEGRLRTAEDSTTIESLVREPRRADAASMRLLRIDHVSLNVHDRLRSVAWYEDVLGLHAQGRSGPPDEPVFLGHASARLGLFADRAPGLRHVALATDVAGLRRVRARLEHLAIPCRSERHRDHDSIYFSDPDGVTVEVMVPTA
jgi:catechol-2,3-dioxygenase